MLNYHLIVELIFLTASGEKTLKKTSFAEEYCLILLMKGSSLLFHVLLLMSLSLALMLTLVAR